MDEQKTPVKSEALAGDTQEVKATTGHLEQIKKSCPDGMHSQVLRELADTIAGLLELVLEQSWRPREVSEEWKKVNVTLGGVKESKCHPSLQNGQEGGPRGLLGSQARPDPWKHDGVPGSGKHLYPHGCQEADQNWSAWIQQRGIMLDQPDCFP